MSTLKVDQLEEATGSANVTINTGSDLIVDDNIQLGHDSDTTLARASSGVMSVEGKSVYMAGGTDVAVADGGTGAGTATAGFDALAPMTTAGDIMYGGSSGTGTRLAASTDGHVLTATGAGSAPAWEANAATKGWNLINTYPVTSNDATILITLKQPVDSDYYCDVFVVSNLVAHSSSSDFYMTAMTSGDASVGGHQNGFQRTKFSGEADVGYFYAGDARLCNNLSTDSNHGVNGIIYFFCNNPMNTSRCPYWSYNLVFLNNSSVAHHITGGGRVNDDLSTVRKVHFSLQGGGFSVDGGNLSSPFICHYAIKHG